MPAFFRPPGGGSGNATVPSDAVILPPQAFVDIMPSLVGGQTSVTFNPATQITFLDDALLTDLRGAGAGNFDFSNCALSAGNIADLADAVAAVLTSGIVDFSGDDNAALADVAVVPELWSLGVNVAGGATITNAGGTLTISYDSGTDLSGSNVAGSILVLGWQDGPSTEAVAAKIVDLWAAVIAANAYLTGVGATDTSSFGSGTVAFSDANDSHFAYSFSGDATETQPGVAKIKNSHIVALVGTGITGFYNGTLFGAHTAF